MLTFATLAATFEELERTSSRSALVQRLTELLDQASADQVAEISYLLQGRVAPLYEPLEFGLGERSIETAIASAYDVDLGRVQRANRDRGDLGLVAEDLAGAASGGSGAERSLVDVFTALRHIAELSGRGSVERKVAALADLLRGLSAVSAKHLVRIPVGKARLGVGDATILAAFTRARLDGTTASREALETAYNQTSDLGLIGATLWRDGLAAVQTLGVAVLRPIRPQLAERLPSAEAILERLGGRVHAQSKFDGMRLQIHLDRDQPRGRQVRLFSRNLEDMTAMFPEIVDGVLAQVTAQSAILDAEVLAFDPLTEEFQPFQMTTRRRRKHHIAEMQAELPLRAMVFDAMFRDGRSLLDMPLLQRIEQLASMLPGDEPLHAEPGQIVTDAASLRALFEQALDRGLEGLVVKRPDSPYQAGARNFNWVKLKRHSGGALRDTLDCVLLGYLLGRGKRASLGVGALLVGVYNAEADVFETVCKLGTGLSDEQWRDLRQRAEPYRVDQQPARVRSLITPGVWLEPEIVVEVLADEITRSPIHTAGRGDGSNGYALRFPRFVRLRESDKRPEDATTVRELVELYQAQRERT